MTVCHLLLYMNILFGEAKVIWTGTDKDKLLSFDITHSVIRGEERIEFILNFANGSLRHFKYSPATGSVSDLLEIAYAVKNAHFAKDKSEECVTVFYEESTGEMFKLSLLSDTDTWEEENIIIDDILDDVVSRNVYVTRIQAANADMSPAVYTEFMLWAKSHLHVKVNGRYHDIGPNAKVQVKTDYKGEVEICHEAFAIAEEDILLSACPGDTLTYWADVHAPYVYADNTINLRVSDRIERKLSKLSGQQLKDAKNLKGSYLLEEKFRNIWSNMITGLLRMFQGVVDLALEALQGVTDILFNVMEELIEAAGKLFDTQIFIPVIGALYRSIFGKSKMTLRDFFVFFLSFNIHTSVRLITQRRPVMFESDQKVNYYITELKAAVDAFDPDCFGAALENATPVTKIRGLGLSKDIRNACYIISNGCQSVSYMCLSLSDALTPATLNSTEDNQNTAEASENKWKNVLDWTIFLSEAVWAFTGCPFIEDSTNYAAVASWVVCDINCILDLAGCCNCCQDESGTVNTVFGIAGTVLGVIYCIFSAINVAKYVEGEKALEWANEPFMMLSGVMRFCMLKSIITITEGCSVAVAVVIDFFAAVMGIVKLGYAISDVTAAEIDGWDESDRAEMAELQEKLNLL